MFPSPALRVNKRSFRPLKGINIMRHRTSVPILLLMLLGLAVPGTLRAGDDTPAGSGIAARSALDRLKSLAGTWKADNAPVGAPGDTIVYHVTGGGSAVSEVLFPGSDHEMLTVYHLDGDDLVLTHYCAAGNQPHLKLDRAGSSPTLLKFDFVGGTNLNPAVDSHMHDIVMRFGPDGQVRWTVTGWMKGQPQPAHEIHLQRQPTP
jgi:hypothetical protein